jgi:hypothetical protein
MVSKGLHGIPGRARLGDENLQKGLRRDRHREHACQNAQGSPCQTGSSQPRVSAGHKGRGEILQVHGGRQEERRPPAGGGYREERKHRDDFGAGRAVEQRMEYEDSIPIERPPTLPVTEILAAERQERSWESLPIGRWCRPTMGSRNRRSRHGGSEHRRTSTSPEWRQGTPASGGQHTAGRRLGGAAPHVFRLFRESGLPAAA